MRRSSTHRPQSVGGSDRTAVDRTETVRISENLRLLVCIGAADEVHIQWFTALERLCHVRQSVQSAVVFLLDHQQPKRSRDRPKSSLLGILASLGMAKAHDSSAYITRKICTINTVARLREATHLVPVYRRCPAAPDPLRSESPVTLTLGSTNWEGTRTVRSCKSSSGIHPHNTLPALELQAWRSAWTPAHRLGCQVVDFPRLCIARFSTSA